MSGREYRKITVFFVFLILIGATIGIAVPAGLGWDFANFYDTGRRVAAGQAEDIYDPASLIGGEKPQGNMRFWGVPLSALFYVPLSCFSPEMALIIFKIQNTLAYSAALLLLYFHNRRFIEDSPAAQSKFAALFAFLALIYQPFWTVYRVGGQTTPTVLMLLTLALLCYMRAKDFLAALLLVFVVMIKPAFIMIVLFLLFISRPQFLGKITATLFGAGVVSVFTMGWSIHNEFLALMQDGLKKPFPWFYNSSLYVVFDNFKALADHGLNTDFRDRLLNILAILVKAIVIATFVYIVKKSRAQKWSNEARRHFNFLMAVSFFLLISQTLWEHYISVLFPILAYIVASNSNFSRQALFLVGFIFVLAMGQNLIFIDFLRNHFRLDSLFALFSVGLFKSGPVLLTFIFLWKYHKELFQSYTAPRWMS